MDLTLGYIRHRGFCFAFDNVWVVCERARLELFTTTLFCTSEYKCKTRQDKAINYAFDRQLLHNHASSSSSAVCGQAAVGVLLAVVCLFFLVAICLDARAVLSQQRAKFLLAEAAVVGVVHLNSHLFIVVFIFMRPNWKNKLRRTHISEWLFLSFVCGRFTRLCYCSAYTVSRSLLATHADPLYWE